MISAPKLIFTRSIEIQNWRLVSAGTSWRSFRLSVAQNIGRNVSSDSQTVSRATLCCEPEKALRVASSLAEALSIFCGTCEGFYHFSIEVVTVEVIQLGQPEIVAGVVTVLRVGRVASQVAKVLH